MLHGLTYHILKSISLIFLFIFHHSNENYSFIFVQLLSPPSPPRANCTFDFLTQMLFLGFLFHFSIRLFDFSIMFFIELTFSPFLLSHTKIQAFHTLFTGWNNNPFLGLTDTAVVIFAFFSFLTESQVSQCEFEVILFLLTFPFLLQQDWSFLLKGVHNHSIFQKVKFSIVKL